MKSTKQSTILSEAAVKEVWKAWLHDLNLPYELTFNFGGKVELQTALGKMKLLCNKVERKAFGPRWFKRSGERLFVVGFMERPQSNCHWHGMASMPAEVEDTIIVYGSTFWKEIAPRGQLNFDRIKSTQEQTASYFTKELHLSGRSDCIFMYNGNDQKAKERLQERPLIRAYRS